MAKRSWDDLVAEGRRLVAQEGEIRWQIADLALEVEPMGKPGATTGSRARLEKWAEEIGWFEAGYSTHTLKQYRETAAAWPEARRLSSTSFYVHHDLRWQEDRFDLIKPGMTLTEARRASGKSVAGRLGGADVERIAEAVQDPAVAEAVAEAVVAAQPDIVARVVSSKPQAARRVAQSALRQRDVADEIMDDPEVRMRARAAAERQSSAAQAQVESERKAYASALNDDSQDVVDGRALTELGGALGRIIGTTRAAAELWRRWEAKVSEDAHVAAVDDIGNAQARVDTILDAMRGADIDATLARILAETDES